MRHLILLITAAATLMSLAGQAAAAETLRVVATLSELGSIANFVGGDHVTVTSIATGAQDAHFLDAKPSYIVLLNKADVLIENGGELEIGWLPNLVLGARNRRILPGAPGRVNAMAGIDVVEVPTALSRAEGDVHPFGNPHFTLDPVADKTIAQNICNAYCALLPNQASSFRSNLDAFNKRIDESLTKWQTQMTPLKGMKIVTFHRSFTYFARRFDLNIVGEIEPKPGVAPSPSYLAELIVKMKSQGVKLLVSEPFRDLKIAKFTADKAGAKLVVVPYGVGGDPEGKDLFTWFDWLVGQLVAAAK